MARNRDLRSIGIAGCIAVGVAAVLVAGGGDARAEQRFALVIGANAGWSQDRPLRDAEHDAERVRDALVSLGGVAADRAKLLRDPDTADVRLALRRLASIAHDSVAEDTVVLVYYAGHADRQHLHLRGVPLSHRELQDTLRSLPATIRIAVIDACGSCAAVQTAAHEASELRFDVGHRSPPGMVWLSSSGTDERSIAGSRFTSHLISGLRGAADGNGDEQVTLAEAYHYADAQRRADTAPGGGLTPPQPALHDELNGLGDLALTRIAVRSVAQLRVARGPPQHYVVLDAHEWRLVAEADAQIDRDVVLAMAPGSYRVKRVFEDHLDVAILALAEGGVADAAALRYEPAPRSRGVLAADPIGLSVAEHREWERERAFGMLADGQVEQALERFDQLRREAPDDLLAARGRGRALVRLAEAHRRVNASSDERRALSDALASDPSLRDDPTFEVQYRRLWQLTADAQRAADERAAIDEERNRNPRLGKRFGFGLDVLSIRGVTAITGSVVLSHMIIASAAIDLGFPGLDVAVTLAPLPSRWSPYAGVGVHVMFNKLGLDLKGFEGGSFTTNGRDEKEILAAHARVEFGAQYVARSFTAELGVAMAAFRAADGPLAHEVMPVVHIGWLW